jgi:hypothetical protein
VFYNAASASEHRFVFPCLSLQKPDVTFPVDGQQPEPEVRSLIYQLPPPWLVFALHISKFTEPGYPDRFPMIFSFNRGIRVLGLYRTVNHDCFLKAYASSVIEPMH